MYIKTNFSNTSVIVLGDQEIILNGEVECILGELTQILGNNGNGKTFLLSTITNILEYPFGFIKNVKISSKDINFDKPIKKVAIVRQNPEDNFLSGVAADEYRIAYADSNYNDEEFKEKLENFISIELDQNIDLLNRMPVEMSSGEQQLIAISVALLADADLIVMDEPLSRLSRKFAKRIIKILEKQISERLLIISTHLDNEYDEFDIFKSSQKHFVYKKGNEILITKEKLDEGAKNFEGIEREMKNIEKFLLSEKSLEKEIEWSENFNNLPLNTVRIIVGNGERITKEPINFDVYFRKEKLTSIKGFNINSGLNILYGDNGAGKTLVASALSGNFIFNPLIRKNRIYARGIHTTFDGSNIQNAPDQFNIKWLRKTVNSFFLPSNPEDIIAEKKIVDEIKSSTINNSIENKFEWLSQFGLLSHMNCSELSYGQKKIVSFSLIPDNLILSVLDEPFANISNEYQLIIARFILEYTSQQKWFSTIITTNRPIETLKIFSSAMSAQENLEDDDE